MLTGWHKRQIASSLLAGTTGTQVTVNWDDGTIGTNLSVSANGRTVSCSGSTTATMAQSFAAKAAGAWYFEVEVDGAANLDDVWVGIVKAGADLGDGTSGDVGPGDSEGYGISATGTADDQEETSPTGPLASHGDDYSSLGTPATIGVAVDFDNAKIWFRNDDGDWAQGSPSAGTSPTFSGLDSGLYKIAVSLQDSDHTAVANFRTEHFKHTAPSGFQPWGAQTLDLFDSLILGYGPISYWKCDENDTSGFSDYLGVGDLDTVNASTGVDLTSIAPNVTSSAASANGGFDVARCTTTNASQQIIGDLTVGLIFQLDGSDPYSGGFLSIHSQSGSGSANNTLLNWTVDSTPGKWIVGHEYGSRSIKTSTYGTAGDTAATHITTSSKSLLILTRDVSAKTYKIYRNGTEIWSWTYTGSDPDGGSSTSPALGDPGGAGQGARLPEGKFQNVFLFNRVLSSSELAALDNATGL